MADVHDIEMVLITYRNIKNVGDDAIFERAVAVASADGAPSPFALGSALDNPATSLHRLNLADPVAVHALVTQGDLLGAQRLILDQLSA